MPGASWVSTHSAGHPCLHILASEGFSPGEATALRGNKTFWRIFEKQTLKWEEIAENKQAQEERAGLPVCLANRKESLRQGQGEFFTFL